DRLINLPPLIDEGRARHILEGDRPGSGGHLWPGAPGKTPFPQGWDAEKVLSVSSDVARDPESRREPVLRGRPAITGTRGGVEVRVIVEPASKGGGVVTAYPKNLPRTQ